MGSADSKVMKKECLSDESEDEACGSGIHSAIAKIPNEVKPRYKLGSLCINFLINIQNFFYIVNKLKSMYKIGLRLKT